ncbi:hypothetical protein [Patulibacter sp.]|uniref:hypothetical protein n=1 Tax=Patulibacter sp. TaxID=1912859 RepID=UPI002716905D|nr:hypothetical protein [Patulibacter sp.]MDO9409808.1 hypothetical protein [Patulibacter sp.]
MGRKVLSQWQYKVAATHRLMDAAKLCSEKRWAGTVYLSGYGIECMLKAELAQELAAIGGWKKHTDSTLFEAMWIHDLVVIAAALAYPDQLADEIKDFSKMWKVSLRYSTRPVPRPTAELRLAQAESIAKQIGYRLT